jgi:hypothetical protein
LRDVTSAHLTLKMFVEPPLPVLKESRNKTLFVSTDGVFKKLAFRNSRTSKRYSLFFDF